MGILAEDVARVREATDIVGLISNTVALRKSGRRWQGLCPFHSEKTPSFSVNAEEGLYYCFGCRASGDAITFVRQTEGLDFAAAVEVLAARAGVTLRYDSTGQAAQSGRRQQLIEAVAAAVEWYHERLLNHRDAGVARGYLRSRGLSGDEVRNFKLGWAPAGWDELSRALRSKASPKVLIDAGLARRNERGRFTDNFHSRVLFPVFDVRGDPVGFGGRILPGGDGPAGPKYKNTPESALYAKSRLLYGLNWAKDAILRARGGQGEVIVCEGYTDVIGLHAAGLPQAVATCGTALTEEHVKILARFTKRIVLAFDADAAGAAAAERIYRWESSYALDVFVAELPEGADPDDLARRAPEVLRQTLGEPRQFLDYRIDRALEGVEGATAQGRVRFADAALAALDEHPSELVRDRYLVPVADRCKLDPALLRATVQRFRAARRGDAASAGGEDAAGVTAAGPADPSIAEQVLLLRVHAPETFPPWVSPGLFESDVHQRILVALANGATLRDLRDAAPQEVAPAVARLAVCDPPACAEPVIGRLVFDAAGRWISATTRRARETGDAALGRRLGEVQLACDELRGSNWSPAAAERLARRLTAVVPGTGTPSPEPGGPTEDGEAETPTRLLSASGEEHFDEGLPASGDEEGFVGNRSGTGTPQR